MKHAVILLIGIVISGYVNAQCLEDLKWENRVLIINATDKSDQLYQDQIDLFQTESEALSERKLKVFQYVQPQLQSVNFRQNEYFKSQNTKNCKFMIKEEFHVILIGLDGSVKLTSKTLVTPKELFAKIDAMPMRRGEINGNR